MTGSAQPGALDSDTPGRREDGGSGPDEGDASLERAEMEAAAEAAAVGPTDEPQVEGVDEPVTANEYTVAFSPKQVAVGLAIVASLVTLLVARRRRGRRAERAD
jgi:hypothetical protein